MWVKICGVRDVPMALAIAETGADAIGLNFYDASPRRVELGLARQIVNELPETVLAVGLFVNHPLDVVCEHVAHLKLPAVQIHGDESPDDLARLAKALPGVKLIRALRVSAETGLGPVHDYLDACRALSIELFACLLDAKVGGAYGGTGQVGPWELIRSGYRVDIDPPLILAGGLTPENIAQAISDVAPWGVDTAGGVESSVACKDMGRVRQFLASARGATHESRRGG
jgi:phosphoribosylanthranilate isomerase